MSTSTLASHLLRLRLISKCVPRANIRSLSNTSVRNVRTTEMSSKQLSGVKIDRERLWKDLHYTCQWGQGERWGDGETDIGMSRLALSDTDKQARDWFVKTTKELGCKVTIDAIGNIFAVRAGRKDGPPTYAGSHLDTQPTGGRYDGILGIHAGIEALKTMNDMNIETEYPTGVVNWTNEEGARFPISMVASRVWAGDLPLEHAHNLLSVGANPVSQKSELERIGYLGNVPASHEANPIGAHFELHIEQGPILENSNQKIGVVEGVQAYQWWTITITGQDCHTGTTDFANRSDAMLVAAKCIVHSHNAAAQLGCLASTGILTLKPGSTNTVPGEVTFSLDIRSKDNDVLLELQEELVRGFELLAESQEVDVEKSGWHGTDDRTWDLVKRLDEMGIRGRGCKVTWKCDTDFPATRFHDDCIRCVEESADDMLGLSSKGMQRMTSGAGHDSVNTSRRAPTSMIFVPCRGGVSHNPAEYCSPEDCGNGAQVLLGAMLRYDKLRAERGAQGT